MEEYISTFLAGKDLAKNSRLAYFYDLQQFVELCQNQVSKAKLAIYQAAIQDCKPSVQKRKQSAVNQFLFFLYEEGHLDRFYKLKSSQSSKQNHQPLPQKPDDLSLLWQETSYQTGQLIALLIASLGLIPSEIAHLRQEHLNLEFQMLTLVKDRADGLYPYRKRFFLIWKSNLWGPISLIKKVSPIPASGFSIACQNL